MKFRKRPIIVEATQWFKKGDHPRVIRHTSNEKLGWLRTPSEWVLIASGDWIATEADGTCYRIKPDIFAETYEAVDDVMTAAAEITEEQTPVLEKLKDD